MDFNLIHGRRGRVLLNGVVFLPSKLQLTDKTRLKLITKHRAHPKKTNSVDKFEISNNICTLDTERDNLVFGVSYAKPSQTPDMLEARFADSNLILVQAGPK